MKQSDTISGLLKALCALQAELPTMPKDASGYGYKYTDLDTITNTIKPLLAKHGLGYVQPITTAFLDGGRTVTAITTRIFNADGEYMEDTAALPEITVGKTNAAQNLGAAITYMRRYGLCSMLGITSDEDVDGNVETHQIQQQRQAPQQRQQAQKPAPRQQKQPAGPAGGPDTPEQKTIINELLGATDSNGVRLFKPEDAKIVSEMRKTKTASETIKELQAECARRVGMKKADSLEQPPAEPAPAAAAQDDAQAEMPIY